jgi:putative thioredoxin
MLEVDEPSFEREVLEASRDVPVLVDLWAPWCGPCRALGPLLEQLEQDYAGRFRLVKVNIDSSPRIATQFQVRSIPYVLAFLDGRPVDGFVGVLPESQLRQFLDRVLPTPSESERRRGRALFERGAIDAAAAALRSAVRLDPGNLQAQLDLAELLIEGAEGATDSAALSEAEQSLTLARGLQRDDARFRALETQLASLRSSAELPDAEDLRRRIQSNPADLAARMALAQRHLAEQRFESALEELLEILRRDRKFQDGAARRMMLDIFELAAAQPDLVTKYRRHLAALINR